MPDTGTIERTSSTDRAFLAMDTGPVPQQFGVLLRLDGDLALDDVRHLLATRVASLPRLRQRLEPTPLGCGGPVWVDEPSFDVGRHVHEVPALTAGAQSEAALLDLALRQVLNPLPRTRPLWRVVLVHQPRASSAAGTGGTDAALVVVLHHTLADGVAGLAVLAGLVDPIGPRGAAARPGQSSATPPPQPVRRPRPAAADLARDAWQRRLHALRDLPRSARLLRSSFAGAGGVHPPRAAPSTLVHRTGPRRAVAVVRTELAPLRAAAHASGASTNDAVLVAAARALGTVLRARGESLPEIVVTVPVAGRSSADRAELGNLVSPMIVPVPTAGPPRDALRRVADAVRAHKDSATGPPPIALLGWAFRPLARVGGYRWYLNHQHRMHTLVSHLRGPADPLTFAGRPVVEALPLAVAEAGNMPVSFEVLSYAGTLTISVVVDPDHFAELDDLAAHLRAELLTFGTG